jgi:hypothetical protein
MLPHTSQHPCPGFARRSDSQHCRAPSVAGAGAAVHGGAASRHTQRDERHRPLSADPSTEGEAVGGRVESVGCRMHALHVGDTVVHASGIRELDTAGTPSGRLGCASAGMHSLPAYALASASPPHPAVSAARSSRDGRAKHARPRAPSERSCGACAHSLLRAAHPCCSGALPDQGRAFWPSQQQQQYPARTCRGDVVPAVPV